MKLTKKLPITKPGVLLLLSVLVLAVLAAGAENDGEPGNAERNSAWTDHLARNPGAADDDTIGPLVRRVLHALTPEQAAELLAGAAPDEIVLDSGQTLAQFLADSVAGGPGLVYVPRDQCRLFATFLQTAPVTGAMAAGEVREFVARGSGVAHTDQGGIVDCLIPTEAVAVALHLRVVAAGGVGNGLLKAWRADLPEPVTTILDYEPTIVRFDTSAIVELCPVGTCAAGEIKVKTVGLAAQIRGDVAGYFRPIEAADVMGAGNADTLDGLDSTDLALVTHTHDGGDIVSGVVGEAFIDPLIARDSEIVTTLLAGDGSGSTLDADLLDGKHVSSFRPRPANLILVDSTDGDYATIQAALDDIGVGLPAATTSNRYLIRVGTGIYAEQVTMKPFVDIEGKGQKVTRITAPSQAGPQGTLECADEAEVRNLTVESTGGGEKAIAVRCLGTAPMLTHVRLAASGAIGGAVPENIGVLNDGAGATPMLTEVDVEAGGAVTITPVARGTAVVGVDVGVVNQNGASPTIRDSSVSGADSAVENRDTASARIVYTGLAGGADVTAPAVQSSFMCVRAYVSGTLLKLNDECNPNTPPTATDDSYKTLGNTLLEVDLAAASGSPSVVGEDPTPLLYADVLDNDIDAEGGLTASASAASTLGGDVAMNPDGSFSYTPPVGLTGVTDDFTYTVTDGGGLTDTGRVEIAISQRVWFIDDVNGSDATGDGRSDGPFASLAPLDTGGAADGLDGSGDTIFVFADDGATAGGILLETNQVLHGHEIALDFGGFNFAAGSVLVTASTAPTIDAAAGSVVDLASGNTIRGLDLSGAASEISGTGVSGLTLDNVGIDASGAVGVGISLSNPTGSFDIDGLTLTDGESGIEINGGSATFDFDAACSIAGSDPAVLISGGSTSMVFNGDVTHNSGTNIAIGVEGGHTGTLTFQNGTISSTIARGLAFDNADGTYNFNGTTTLNGGTAGIDIVNGSNGTFTFGAGTTITNPSGVGFNLDTSSGGNVNYNGTISQSNAASAVKINAKTGGSVTFSSSITASTSTANGIDLTSNSGGTFTFSGLLDIDTTTGTGFNATGGGTVQVTNAGNTVDTVGDGVGNGIGINIGAGIGGLGVGFSAVNVGSSGKAASGILLSNTGAAGTFSVTGGTIQNTTGASFAAINVDGPVNVGASLQNDGGRSVDIVTGSAGTFTFTGAIDEDALGINISSNGAGGTFTLQGGVDIDTIGANTGLRAFSSGTLNVCADTNCSAPGGAAVTNTIDVGAATALSVDSVAIGTEGVTFRSISANGGTNGIVLDTTGAGSFEITGDGSTATLGGNDTGGVIQSTSGDGIVLTAAQGVTLRNMTIGDTTASPANSPDATNNITGDGIQATGVTGLNLLNVTIARTGGHGVNAVSVGGAASVTDLTVDDSLILNAGDGQEEHGLNLDELRGDNFVRDSLFDAFNETGLELINLSGAVDLTVDNTTFQDNKATVGNAGEEAILIEAQGSASIVALVTGSAMGTTSIFDDISRQAIQAISLGTSSDIQLTVENSSFVETSSGDAIIIMNPDNAGSGNLTVRDNTFTDDTLGPFAVLVKNDSSGTLDATIQGNTVTNMQLMNLNHDDIGSGGAANGTSRVLVGGSVMGQGNTVTVGSNNIAIDVIATETGPTGTGPDVCLTLLNNTTSQPDNIFTFTPALRVRPENATRFNANISGNSFQGDPTCCGGAGIELREFDAVVFGLQGFAGGTAAAAAAFIDAANPASSAASDVQSSVDGNYSSGTASLPNATTQPNP